jgi:mono/diheme cytochrome c family protein
MIRKSIVSAALAVLLVAPIVLAAAMMEGDAEAGKAAFLKRCKMCHGADGNGNPAMARMLKVEFHAMDSEYVQEKTPEELRNVILKGKGKMVAVRGISEKEVTDIISYLQSLDKGAVGR